MEDSCDFLSRKGYQVSAITTVSVTLQLSQNLDFRSYIAPHHDQYGICIGLQMFFTILMASLCCHFALHSLDCIFLATHLHQLMSGCGSAPINYLDLISDLAFF